MTNNPLFRRDPLLRYAISLGFSIKPGRKHWHATHPGGGFVTIPFGRKRPVRSVRNITASIKRAAATPTPTPTP